MEESSTRDVSVRGLVPTGNIGGGLAVGYACLCVAFWANAIGLCAPGGFTIAIGVVLLGFFVVYFVGGLYFLKQGNTLAGAIFVTFGAVFGLFGGAVNLAGSICAELGVPFDFTAASLSFVIAGLFLLLILPAMKGFSKVDFTCYLASGVGVAAFGVAGLGIMPDVVNLVGGWSILVGGICAFYGAVATVYASVGKQLPTGRPFF